MTEINYYRTDLIDESDEFVRHQGANEEKKLKKMSGISVEEQTIGRIKATTVKVTAEGEEEIGKAKGTYITLTIPTLAVHEIDELKKLCDTVVEKMDNLLKEKLDGNFDKILFIGLGNPDITPDAVGPVTMGFVKEVIPDYYEEDDSGILVYAPGVTIQTGLETASFVKAIVEEAKPDVLIVVDALAARSSSRLCRTVQLTDTGIHPGSGVGNSRKELSENSLGIPVIAIGVPTVVDGPVLVADAIDTMFGYIAAKIEEEGMPSSKLATPRFAQRSTNDADRTSLAPIFGDWSSWSHEERIQLFEEVLTQQELSTFISPKEIDSWVAQYATSLSSSLLNWIRKVKE
ncbi:MULTISPECIES: GPR endopeptidase [unclassified Sporosarcina]|uniref:GPR endopeptidase n=1 Tax=unclassified Sporosarcina TaxID=2647733 RepID=UPI002040236F|nr:MULTISPECIES: GPR endopeptidase [unclassified Sporosarcina]GKV66739.1 germination protease [Sporosarcina sp. NCCP-2331]GLB57078.1 germination protease [Sporosarcina sp. NCCP-2378]